MGNASDSRLTPHPRAKEAYQHTALRSLWKRPRPRQHSNVISPPLPVCRAAPGSRSLFLLHS